MNAGTVVNPGWSIRALAALAGLGLAFAVRPDSSHAQSAPAEPAAASLQEIVVTGTSSWSGLKAFRFSVGARNVFDKDPPYANYAASANNFVGGYDLSYGDPRGRFVYGRIDYTIY